MSRMVFDDSTWAKLKRLLPAPKGRHGENDRLFLEAIGWVLRTGAPWRDLLPEYGNWKTIYNRFNRWVKKGYFEEIFKFLKKKMAITPYKLLMQLSLKLISMRVQEKDRNLKR